MIREVHILISAIMVSYYCLGFPGRADTAELNGSVALQGRLFTDSPASSVQKHNNAALALTAELYQEFSAGSSITITPFTRLDSADSERNHFDFRELNYLYLANTWELKTGISKIFWGATEFVHLVDIINQTDLVENINGEEKLGQPMFHLSMVRDWGIIDTFLLPYFRTRTFPGEKGRLRGSAITTSQPRYESTAEQHHLDFAIRYYHTINNCDLGISQFIGTGREPELITETNNGDKPTLTAYYQQIKQTSLDLQLVDGVWLWKGEALYREGQGQSYLATTFGFEYSTYGFAESPLDLGIIAEYIFDDRDDAVPSPYENDIMMGCRLAFNDIDNTEILIGLIKDLNYSSTIFTLEGGRRIGESVRLEMTGILFQNIDPSDAIIQLQDDSFLKLEVLLYF